MITRIQNLSSLAAALMLVACGAGDAPAADAAPADDRASPAPAAASPMGDVVLGTIEATVEGQPLQWHVVSGSIGGQPYASGLWMGETAGERQVSAGGFDTPEPPLETFEREPSGMPISYGDYHGSVMSIVVSETLGAAPFVVRFGPEQDVSEASVFYQPEATLDGIMNATYWLAEGTLEVTDLAIDGDVARLAGTFAGTFRSMGTGEEIQIENGRFSIDDLPSLAVLQP